MDFNKTSEHYGDFKKKAAEEVLIKSSLDISAMERAIKSKISGAKKGQSSLFASRLEEILEPTLSAKELIEKIIRAAIEVEFGPSFTLSKGFDKMISNIADSIITNPDLRREALSVASNCIGKKISIAKENKSVYGGKKETKEKK